MLTLCIRYRDIKNVSLKIQIMIIILIPKMINEESGIID